MAKYKCQLCGHIYDEEKEGVKFEDLPDDWKCPMCFAPKNMFKLVEEDAKQEEKVESKEETRTNENRLENYLKEYTRSTDEVEQRMEDIHTMAITGKSIISAMGTKLPVTSWNDILILGGQLSKMPLFEDEEVSLRTVIGKNAKKPMILETPVFETHMSFGALSKEAKTALAIGTNLSSVLIAISTFGILYVLGMENWFWIGCSVIVGLLVGIVIGQATEYYTSQSYKPTRLVSESGLTGPATVIISGLGLGMLSTAIPVLAVVVGIICSFLFASGFDFTNVGMGLYGIGIAAVGMLSTLGITLATDAYGPIADNAGGNAEMCNLGKEVRKRTDALDSLGNTTAATGKGFAIGSAALTGLALLASYVEEIKIGLLRLGETVLNFTDGRSIEISKASFSDFMVYYDVTLMNPKVLAGMFLGSMMAFMFCGLTMNAVGRAAGHMVEEVRRQFKEIKGILTGEAQPDYARCVEISTKGAQHEMVLPAVLAIIAPILTGLIFGVTGVVGLLIGGLSTGFVLAVFMANAGGAWDNAKKFIEEGNHGGKGSEAHKATVVGDTVGDPFKDTSGPSLNILIKLMSMVAIVMAGLTVAWSLF